MIADAIAKLLERDRPSERDDLASVCGEYGREAYRLRLGTTVLAGTGGCRIAEVHDESDRARRLGDPKVESTIFVGLWSELMIGMRTEARLEISRRAPGVREARRRLWSVYLVSRELV
jgi:hypothetical protein